MGDMADFLLGQAMDAEDLMGLDWDDESDDLPGAAYRGYESLPKTCKSCGQGGLYWKDTDKGWRLADAQGREHKCKNVTCKRCQKEGLQWVDTGKGWRLFGDYGIHVCGEED